MLFLKKLNKQSALIVLLTLANISVFPQNGGERSFTFIDLPISARLAGLGGVNASLANDDISFFLSNPALLSDKMDRHALVSFSVLPASSNLSSVAYSQKFEKAGIFAIGLRYISFGDIQGYDASGQATAVFKPRDVAITVSHSRNANNFRIGASMTFVNESLAGYNSSSILFDIGGVFVHPTMDLTVGVVVKNVGFVVSEFSPMSDSSVPADVQLGTSIKPEHMPIRFSLTFQKLNQWNLQSTEEKQNETNQGLDNAFRHVVLGSEILLNKHVHLLFAYNHLRRKELRLTQHGAFSGFSIGTVIKARAYEFTYAFSGYHVAGNANTLTLTGNLSEMKFKKSKNG